MEWWDNRPDGVEHGWTVMQRPKGSGPLLVRIRIDGARVELHEEAASLMPKAGAALAAGS